MSDPSDRSDHATVSPSRAEHAVFAQQSASSWLATAGLHAVIAALGLLAVSVGVSPEARRRISSVVRFDVPPTPPPPRALAPTPIRRAQPRPAANRATRRPPPAPTPAPTPERPTAAPPPILTAASSGSNSGFRMPSGDNTDYRGGAISQHGERTAFGGRGAGNVADAGPPVPDASTERTGRSGAIAVPEDGPPLRPLAQSTPEYPEEVRAQGISGTVFVGVIIGEDGHVMQAVALRGPEPLREVARQAALRWHFAPYVIEGLAVRIRYVLRFPFELTNL
ncbi:MAG: energy transducer TonB [Deltaproteobacteria bacterium]|nr:energy transducer TonB [Deltaproteobacteria bacterium]